MDFGGSVVQVQSEGEEVEAERGAAGVGVVVEKEEGAAGARVETVTGRIDVNQGRF